MLNSTYKKTDWVVGSTVYLKEEGYRTNDPVIFSTGVVTKVGNKYVTVSSGTGVHETEKQYHIDNGDENNEYQVRRWVFPTLVALEEHRLYEAFREAWWRLDKNPATIRGELRMDMISLFTKHGMLNYAPLDLDTIK